jgi:fructokinase
MQPAALRIGVDLGGTKIEALALGPDGQERARRRVPTPQGDYAGTVAAVADLVHMVERELGASGTVGIGTPGSRSPATGLMRGCNSVVLNGRALKEDLEQALGRSIALANDADCFALSEASDGAGQGADVVFGVILGTGVGGGLALHGRLVAGANAIAGEWGHTPLPWPTDDERPGPPCWCGRHGCIETWLSGPALAADHARAGGTGSAADILAAAASGDAIARSSLDRWLDRLARCLAVVIDIVDPHVVVLGGGLSNIARAYAELPDRLAPHVFSDVVRTTIVPPRHGDSSGVRGAAWLGAG